MYCVSIKKIYNPYVRWNNFLDLWVGYYTSPSSGIKTTVCISDVCSSAQDAEQKLNAILVKLTELYKCIARK